MHGLAQSLRFAVRRLLKTRGFTAIVILTLALGLGAATAIFSLVEGILLRPLPFLHPDRLVLLGDHLGPSPGTAVTATEIATYIQGTNAFSSIGAYTDSDYEISGGALPEEVKGARLTAGMFPTLGIGPLLGRTFTAQEEAAHQPVAVLSYALWSERYHRDPHILGGSLQLDRTTYTILGVMPRGFEFPLRAGHLDQAQLWVPLSLMPEELSTQNAGNWRYNMVARLKDGVTLEQAARDADRVARQIMRDFPAAMSAIHIRGDVQSLHENTVADARPLLQTLFAAVLVVLLIACINVAGLLLVRAIRRRREYGVRLALGAGSSTILRESILEGLLLSGAGGLLGLACATAVIRVALHLLPDSMPRISSISINAAVVVFALFLAAATGVLCSLAPAFAALRTNLIETLKDGMPSDTRALRHTGLRSSLVALEIAVALMLLTLSGALLRSFQKMVSVDPGFRADHVLVASYQLPLAQFPTADSADRFNLEALRRLTGKPGIVAAGITNFLAGSGVNAGAAYTIEGVPIASWKLQFANFACTYGDYFRAMGIPLLDGRTFTQNDRANAPLVIIVNQSMARHSWPGQPAVGKRMHVGNPQKGYPWATVVGVVGDTKIGARDEPSTDQWYSPAQQPAILYGTDASPQLSRAASGYITLRSGLPPEQLASVLRATVAEIDPLLALQQIQPLTDVVSHVEAPRRLSTTLISSFAAAAVLLAVLGIYAVMSFSVSLRRQEIAIRMALGAQRSGIAQLVLISASKTVLVGCGLGILGSLAISRLVRSFLFDVSPADPMIYLAAVLTMMALALLASLLPAARAASLDPLLGLRSN